jgi:hypothetical protein
MYDCDNCGDASCEFDQDYCSKSCRVAADNAGASKPPVAAHAVVAPVGGEVRITDPKTGGQKGQKEERFDLFPYDALEEVARVYGRGAKKYADDNWLKGYSWRLSAGAMMRHFARFMLGEDRVPGSPPGSPPDPTTGCLHLACVAWHALTLITFYLRGLGTDDRAKLATAPEAETPEAAENGDYPVAPSTRCGAV